MNQTITITPKWQVHIPVSVREQLHLIFPTQMTVKVVNNSLVLTPKKSKILHMAGSLSSYAKKRPDINLVRIRDHIYDNDL